MRCLNLLLLGLVALASSSTHAFCFNEAGQAYRIDPLILRSIAIHESRMNPATVAGNTNDTWDIGLMGINTVHLNDPYLIRAGFRTAQDLQDPCTNVMLGAWLLSRKLRKWGQTWQAVGAYHSETPELNLIYQTKIYAVFKRVTKSVGDQER